MKIEIPLLPLNSLLKSSLRPSGSDVLTEKLEKWGTKSPIEIKDLDFEYGIKSVKYLINDLINFKYNLNKILRLLYIFSMIL